MRFAGDKARTLLCDPSSPDTTRLASHLQCVGTSAAVAGVGTYAEQRAEVARVAFHFIGAEVHAGVIQSAGIESQAVICFDSTHALT